MSTTLEAALDRIRERAEDDPEFADAVVHIAEHEGRDPFARPGTAVLDLATGVNRRRQVDRDQELRHGSLTTAQVVELLDSISDRKGVDRRRKRGTLLGIRIGRDTHHPAWQFDQRRRETWEGLADVLAALAAVATDGIEAHAIATAPHAVVDGRSIAQLLAAGEPDAALEAARLAGDLS